MRTQILLKCALLDSQPFKPGTRRLTFLQDEENGPAPSTADTPESPLIAWLTSDPSCRGLLFDVLELHPASACRLQVKRPFITDPSAKPGDIDFMACTLKRPHQAVVIEWKRVKVIVTEDGKDKVNKLGAIVDARSQVTGLAKLGFHRTFLGIVAAVDGRNRLDKNALFRGTSDETFKRTLGVADGLDLPEHVGIIYVEQSQPFAKDVREAAMVCAGIAQPARPRVQSHDTTTLVERYFREHG